MRYSDRIFMKSYPPNLHAEVILGFDDDGVENANDNEGGDGGDEADEIHVLLMVVITDKKCQRTKNILVIFIIRFLSNRPFVLLRGIFRWHNAASCEASFGSACPKTPEAVRNPACKFRAATSRRLSG